MITCNPASPPSGSSIPKSSEPGFTPKKGPARQSDHVLRNFTGDLEVPLSAVFPNPA